MKRRRGSFTEEEAKGELYRGKVRMRKGRKGRRLRAENLEQGKEPNLWWKRQDERRTTAKEGKLQ